MMDNSVIVENLVKTFKVANDVGKNNTINALDGISFTIKKGDILGVIGRNGSGKTTLLRTISGIYRPTRGNITVNGKLAPVLQIGVGFKNEISAIENIIMYGLLLGLQKSEIKNKIGAILEFADLGNFGKMKLKHYSSGMRARLAFATAMQVKSDIFLVDEILAVGDMEFREKSQNSFKKLKEQNKTIIHTTHSLLSVEEFSDRVLLLDKGKQIDIGEPKEIIKKYRDMISREQ